MDVYRLRLRRRFIFIYSSIENFQFRSIVIENSFGFTSHNYAARCMVAVFQPSFFRHEIQVLHMILYIPLDQYLSNLNIT